MFTCTHRSELTWYASEAAVAAASSLALETRGPSLCITTALAIAPITDRQLAPTRKLDTKVRTRNFVSCSLHHNPHLKRLQPGSSTPACDSIRTQGMQQSCLQTCCVLDAQGPWSCSGLHQKPCLVSLRRNWCDLPRHLCSVLSCWCILPVMMAKRRDSPLSRLLTCNCAACPAQLAAAGQQTLLPSPLQFGVVSCTPQALSAAQAYAA